MNTTHILYIHIQPLDSHTGLCVNLFLFHAHPIVEMFVVMCFMMTLMKATHQNMLV